MNEFKNVGTITTVEEPRENPDKDSTSHPLPEGNEIPCITQRSFHSVHALKLMTL